MVSHPYISGPGNIAQMIGYLRKNFPATVSSDTVKKYGLASNNESYVINALQFIGLIDDEGKRTDLGQKTLSVHEDEQFKGQFSELLKVAYKDLFEIYGEDAWVLPKAKLIGYFRQSDKTSEVIGTRQAGVFQTLRTIAGREGSPEAKDAKAPTPKKQKTAAARVSPQKANGLPPAAPKHQGVASELPGKSEMALTVRIEINLPSGGDQQTYDAIFKSIKANLYP